MDIWDWTLIKTINDIFWYHPFYVELYVVCLLSLIVFWKEMKRGRRFFFLYSVICLVFFVYNPVFVNLTEKYFLHGEKVIIRVFQLLPLLLTEAYVLASVTAAAVKKSKILSIALTVALTFLLLFFGVTPWQRMEKGGWWADMYFIAENAYKIPQEHIDICDAIIADMDGNRSVLALYELRGINDTKGTLNYSIRMYTSKIQLDVVMDFETYYSMPSDERTQYWTDYISGLESYDVDNTNIYFIFPQGDERASDLLAYGCRNLPVDSSTYQVLVYTPRD